MTVGTTVDGASEKGQEYQAVRIFGKDTLNATLLRAVTVLLPLI